MLLRLEHVGPLREAEIDLSKDLIILTGPNNTGKTYLAWSVYGLHRMRFKPSGALTRWAKALLEPPEYQIDVGQLFERDQEEILGQIATDCESQIHQCFAAERGRFDGARIRITVSRDVIVISSPVVTVDVDNQSGEVDPGQRLIAILYSGGPYPGQLGLALTRGDPAALRVQLVAQVEPTVDRVKRISSSQETGELLAVAPREAIARIEGTFIIVVYRWLLHSMLPRCILFPAERIAVNIFARELAVGRTKLVEELVDASLEGQEEVSLAAVRSRAGSYPWPIRDSLETANSLAQITREETEYADLAAEIEQAVLGGKIGVSEHGGMFFSPDGAPDQRLEVHLTASVVKSLSSLVFYFRHQARKGDFLIIDEPELNLHPDNQRKVARLLAKAVRRGFKIMMSTHSDYITRELNHLVMLSKLPADEARELGYDPGCALEPKQLGVYLFNEHTAQPIPVEETGFSVQTIDDEINAMNVDAQRLYARVIG